MIIKSPPRQNSENGRSPDPHYKMASSREPVATQPCNEALRLRNGKPTRRQTRLRRKALLLAMLAPAAVEAQSGCISLEGSSACPAWPGASISSDPTVVGTFSFLQSVTDLDSFDEGLDEYVRSSYIREKFQAQWGCGAVPFDRADDLYARFTKTTICSALIQMSKETCGASDDASRPVCAETCAQFAQSEAQVSVNQDLCPSPGTELAKLIRADFVTCSQPEEALSSSACIRGIENEPDNCGFGTSSLGLCSYCKQGDINSTDTCCYNSDVDTICEGVVLPSISSTMTFSVPSPTPTADGPDEDDDDDGGLSGGAIAGIVIGAVVGAILLAGLLYMCFMLVRRRRRGSSQSGSIFNQPSPARKGPVMTQAPPPPPTQKSAAATQQPGYEVLPGGRIARMSALEGHSGESPSRTNLGPAAVAAGAGVGAAAYMAGRRRGDNHSSSDEFGDSPESDTRAGVLRPPPTTVKRNASLSSGSHVGEDAQSPTSAGGMSSPQGMASQQSEQLPFFKDYYSADDIHPGDRVAVLWAYQPRAADEFALDRGDMLKVVGIWDDGWATGIMLDERAEEWEARRQAQRDSGVSNTSGRRDSSPPVSGEIKAFPLVCVCLPEHWRKTIDGDGSTETGSSAHQGGTSVMS